jgi:hypothetical protein
VANDRIGMKSVLFISLMNGGAWGGSEELWFQTALYAAKHGYKKQAVLFMNGRRKKGVWNN